jgi:hypothetical protein
MKTCRGQTALEKKVASGPLQTGQAGEYSVFARTIDEQIKTGFVSYLMQSLPNMKYCEWRFTIDGKKFPAPAFG